MFQEFWRSIKSLALYKIQLVEGKHEIKTFRSFSDKMTSCTNLLPPYRRCKFLPTNKMSDICLQTNVRTSEEGYFLQVMPKFANNSFMTCTFEWHWHDSVITNNIPLSSCTTEVIYLYIHTFKIVIAPLSYFINRLLLQIYQITYL